MQVASAAVSSLSDVELALRVAQGDQGAFRQLTRQYNRVLYRAARSILQDDAEAEDALQEAYLHAFRGIGSFRGEAKLSTWLVRIVINEALARLRERGRAARAFPINRDGEDPDAAEEQSESAPEQPERAAQRAETRRLLEAKIDLLPGAFRTVFMLRALEELSTVETAAALEIPQATVRTRFFRARSQLRAALSREVDREIPAGNVRRGGFIQRLEKDRRKKMSRAYAQAAAHASTSTAANLPNPGVQGVSYEA
ncbi:MAG TPA: RNA polymerase sigma factor [Burkholderiales bacterium]|nr:RNA polymerase sigma factor [Burkholderiales bacterium]